MGADNSSNYQRSFTAALQPLQDEDHVGAESVSSLSLQRQDNMLPSPTVRAPPGLSFMGIGGFNT